jgi:hypothetical protein
LPTRTVSAIEAANFLQRRRRVAEEHQAKPATARSRRAVVEGQRTRVAELPSQVWA